MPQSSRPSKVRWLVFALCCTSSFVLYLHRYTWGFIKSDVREEFGWSEWQLGLLDGAFSASYGFGQIPSGILCDWFGPHILLGSIIVFWSVSMGAVALATGMTSMLAARLIFGITQAGCYPILSKVTKLWFPLSIRTSVQGWIATFFGRGGGAACFLLFGTVLIGWMELSWREAVGVLTVVGIVFGLIFFLLFRNTPADHPWANDAEADLIAEGSSDAVQATGTTLRWSSVLKSGNMRIFFVQQFTSAYADNVYIYWIPLFLMTAKHVDVKSAGWMAALPLLGGAVGGMIGGILQSWLIHRTGNRRWSRSWIGLIGKLLATILMFVSLGFDQAVVIVSIFAAVKFFGDWSQPTVWGTVTDVAGKNAASVFGCVNTVGSIAAVVAGPTMGLMIMSFSQSIPIELETAHAAVRTEKTPAHRTVYEPLAHLNIDGPFSGTVYVQSEAAARFEVDDRGEFSFTPLNQTTRQPSIVGSRVDRMRSKITLAWTDDAPENTHLVVDYRYTDFGSGWNALFVLLGGIYLVSSLCWLFIDCTKPLEEEAG